MKIKIVALALITCSSFLSASSTNSAGNTEHPLSRKARRHLARAQKEVAGALESGHISALSEQIVPFDSGVLRDNQAQSNSQAATAAVAQ